jgi:hypothetical protein
MFALEHCGNNDLAINKEIEFLPVQLGLVSFHNIMFWNIIWEFSNSLALLLLPLVWFVWWTV